MKIWNLEFENWEFVKPCGELHQSQESLQDNDVCVQWYIFKSDQGRGVPRKLLTHILLDSEVCKKLVFTKSIIFVHVILQDDDVYDAQTKCIVT